MTKYFVLDTNVLIHNPEALYSFTDNTIIIPITVVEELDRFKSHSDKKGMHARQALREIDAQIKRGALKKGAKMKNGGTMIISLDDYDKKIPYLDPSLNDNKILAAAYTLKQQDEMVFFISKDVNARIKAEALDIPARDYEKQKVEYSALYKGWRELTVPGQQVDEIYKNGVTEVKGYTLFHNEYALLKDEGGQNKSALARFDYAHGRLELVRETFEGLRITPRNLEQHFAVDLLLNDRVKLVTLIGQAGTGKTLIALAAALKCSLGKSANYKKILIARPVMPMGKDIGFLPGDKDEKLKYWMQPIFDNLEFIFSGGKNEIVKPRKKGQDTNDRIDNLIEKNVLEIEALTFIRGRSIPEQFLIVDEAQNLTPHEIKTIVSRAGEGSKIVLTGDPEQIDNPYLDANSNGLSYTVERLKDNEIVGHMFLSKSERSDLAALAVEKL
ncbi:MAG: PhoH family protein [bacterium]|nr:PhoH family protein [bacterium]